MDQDTLAAAVQRYAQQHDVVGAAAGILTGDDEYTAGHGITSTEAPQPVDADTLFLIGSVSKTFTATMIMTLVADGMLALDDHVVQHLPGFEPPTGLAAMTIGQLLNHTSGLDWGVIADTGEGDDALARYVNLSAGLPVVGMPGERMSYSQAGFNLLGRIVEHLTGATFEHAVTERLLQPLGMDRTFYDRDDVMTRRFCVGHNRAGEDLQVARLWRRSRGDNPGGGVVTCIRDLLTWARFHSDGDRSPAVLPAALRTSMMVPTVRVRASNLGDAVGLCWFLRSVGGLATVAHAGSANGQFAEMVLVPSQQFAVVSTANTGPGGIPFTQDVRRWALAEVLGVDDADPAPCPVSDTAAAELVGLYSNEVMTMHIRRRRDHGIELDVRIKQPIRDAADKELPPDHAPFPFALLAGRPDEYLITEGAFTGQRGYFTRDEAGRITGIDLAGRLFSREDRAGD